LSKLTKYASKKNRKNRERLKSGNYTASQTPISDIEYRELLKRLKKSDEKYLDTKITVYKGSHSGSKK
jgi:hypothetical protein